MNQDTPNFDVYKSRFNTFLLPNLVDQPNNQVAEPHKSIITDAYEKIGTYFTEDKFRQTLSLTRKNNIEGNINATLEQFQQILNYASSGSGTLSANIQNITSNIQSYLEEIDLRFWNPYQIYLLQDKENISQTIEKIKKGAREVEAARNSSEENLKAAGQLISLNAEALVADYFQRSVNGLSIEHDERLNKQHMPFNYKNLIASIIVIAVVLLIGSARIAEIISEFNKSNVEHYIILTAIVLLIGAYPIKTFLAWMEKTRPSGYERAASLWLIAAVLSVVGTGIYATILLNGFNGSSTLLDLVPKIISLLAPAYLIRFCTQNYRANKHMATMNSQKAIAAKSLLAYTRNLTTSDESLKSQNNGIIGDIQKNIATIIFDPGETGFITVKEGAGTSDSFFHGSGVDRLPLK